MAKGGTVTGGGDKAAKGKVAGASATGTKGPNELVMDIDEGEIAELEKETIKKVNQTISALETAIASWDAAAKKPEGLRSKFVKYRLVHEVLSRWQTKALKAQGKGSKLDERLGLLWEFVDICRIYV